MNGCLYLIKQYLKNLAPSERKAADYLLANPSQAVNMGVQEIAQKAQTSAAALIRLSRRLGYKGYSDLRMSLAQEVFSSETEGDDVPLTTLAEHATVSSVVQTLVEGTADTIRGIQRVLSHEAIEDAVRLVTNSSRIVISGVGASGIVATDLQQKLARLGIYAVYTSDPDMQVVLACSLTQDDLVIAISYSGESESILKVGREARKNCASLLSITRIGGNSLSRLSSTVLHVPNNESLFREGATLSRINQLLVVDILFAMILMNTHDTSSELLKRTWEAVSHVGKGD